MSTKTIKEILGLDTVSRTAQDVVDANSGYVLSKIEPYMYLCLMELLHYANQDKLKKHIIRKYGSNLTMADSGIQLAFSTQEGELSDVATNSLKDRMGSEFGYMSVLVNIHDPVVDDDFDTVEQVHLRIRYILDQHVRNYTRGAIAAVNPAAGKNYLDPTNYDYSIEPTSGVVARWLKFDGSESALEMVSVYSLQYVRRFPK